jgi:hypothetical protein
MLLADWVKVPAFTSLGVVVSILVGSILLSVLRPPAPPKVLPKGTA